MTTPNGEQPANSLVVFVAKPTMAETSWTGDEVAASGPVVPDIVVEGPPSWLVEVTPDRSIDAVFVNRPAGAAAPRRTKRPFVHEGGRFRRRTTTPSFTGLVCEAGCSAALASWLRT